MFFSILQLASLRSLPYELLSACTKENELTGLRRSPGGPCLGILPRCTRNYEVKEQ